MDFDLLNQLINAIFDMIYTSNYEFQQMLNSRKLVYFKNTNKFELHFSLDFIPINETLNYQRQSPVRIKLDDESQMYIKKEIDKRIVYTRNLMETYLNENNLDYQHLFKPEIENYKDCVDLAITSNPILSIYHYYQAKKISNLLDEYLIKLKAVIFRKAILSNLNRIYDIFDLESYYDYLE